MIEFLQNLLALSLEAAPWLVLGLLIGGLIKALIPTSLLQKHLSGNGVGPVFKAAIFGAPLPLCSCGVIPAALGLRRAGASKPATVSFLVATPETGIDSVSISYALLGPFMAIVRPIAAITSAITAGLLVGRAEEKEAALATAVSTSSESGCCASEKPEPAACCGSEPDLEPQSTKAQTTSCCSSEQKETSCCESTAVETSCCGSSESDASSMQTHPPTFSQKAWDGIVYSFTDLFDKVLFWLVIGLMFAAAVKTYVPVTFLAEWGSGLPAMLVMLVVGIPMYVCATASTPIAAGLLLAGISPGTAMVYLMAGPATNISTLGVIGKELGKRSLVAYLSGVAVIAILTGYSVDYLIANLGIDVHAQIAHSHEMLPGVIAWASLLLLIAVVVKIKAASFLDLKTQTN